LSTTTSGDACLTRSPARRTFGSCLWAPDVGETELFLAEALVEIRCSEPVAPRLAIHFCLDSWYLSGRVSRGTDARRVPYGGRGRTEHSPSPRQRRADHTNLPGTGHPQGAITVWPWGAQNTRYRMSRRWPRTARTCRI
jgi:hypothetical protein